MKAQLKCVAIATAVLVSGFVNSTKAANLVPLGSGVQAFFGSQSDTNQISDPTGLNPWTALGISGAPTTATPLAIAPSFVPTPTITVPAGFLPFAGSGHYSGFNDGVLPLTASTDAKSIINDIANPSPSFVTDAAINIPFWRFNQASGATGYAYEQMDFQSNYVITSNTFGLTTSAAAPTLYITGNVVPGGSAFMKFDAVINYSWIPVTVNTTGVSLPGLASSLGSVQYSFTQIGGGAFTQSLNNIAAPVITTPTGDGVLVLTGHAWIAGDPFDVSIVPEPTSLALLSIAGMISLRRRQK